MDETGIYARDSQYLACPIQVGVAGEKVVSVSFPTEVDADGDHPLLDRIEAYLEGGRDDFADVEVGLTVSTYDRQILEATREIPYGEQVDVETLARMAGNPDPPDETDAAMAVREALAGNPVPLLIPDHRVRDGPSAAPPDVEQKFRALEEL